MNRTYALVWNPSLATWSVANEHARRRGKGAGAVLASALLLPVMAFAADLPTGGQVVAGQGQIGTPANNQLMIDQASGKLAINWQSFDIAAGHKVIFNQPGTDSIALNRVLGADGSKIMGQLDANGRVFIINPNGVLFGQGAQVNVGGLVASTLDISNGDFEAGNYQFKGNGSNASVINSGQITAADGGAVALLGGTVSNNGVIVANQGSVALAAGNKITLDFAGDGLLNVQVDEAVIDALVENHKLIKADGGQVLLTADAGEALLKTVVNNTGVIEAQTLGEKDGKIVLLGSFDGGSVQVAGTLDASAPNGGDGGFIETSGAHVKVADSAKVSTKAATGKTGTWLIDPNDFTVAASGGNMTGAAVSTAVQNNNFEIQTATMGTAGGNGDIHINDAITWSSNNTLTLTAERNININSAITATGAAAGLVLNYGGSDYYVAAPVTLSGANASLAINGTAYTLIHSMAQLDNIDSTGLSGHYALAQNLNASGTTYDHALVGTSFGSSFTGTFAGLGHTISDLTISASGSSYIGLFGVSSGIIRDIGLGGGSITGADGSNSNVGGLVGYNQGSIRNAFNTGNVNGNGGNNIGGLVGYNTGNIRNAYATGNVTGGLFVGGLVGANERGTISNAYATGNVSGRFYVGGLAGTNDMNFGGSIDNAYATGSVTGDAYLGGLVGEGRGATTNSFYATTDANGNAINNGGNGKGIGKTWAELNDASTFAAWDFANTWRMTATGAGTEGYAFYGLPTLQGVTRKSEYQLFDSGLGTQANPWAITNWQQLQNINTNVTTLNGHFTLNADLNQYSLGYYNLASATANGGAGWTTLGGAAEFFAGTFDGQNHTLSDLTINASGPYVGLFGFTDTSSVIRNIGLLDTSVTSGGNSYVGALVGFNQGAISNAYATGNVEGGGVVGGLVGLSTSTLSNVYASVSVTGLESVGGLVGINNGSISNAYATSTVAGDTRVGGLVGLNNGGISNAYATGSVSGTDNLGGLVGRSSGAGIITSSFYATTDANGSAINNSGSNTGAFSGNTLGTGKTWGELTYASTFSDWDPTIWSFPEDASVAGYGVGLPYLASVTRAADIVRGGTLFAGGFGTASNAYTITSWQQLANINQVLGGGYHFSLSNNLDKNSTGYNALASATANGGAGWNPLGNNSIQFTGTFNGLSHTISDLTINRSNTDTDYAGLFGYTGSGSSIHNVGMEGGSTSVTSSDEAYAGGLVGYNNGTISNSYATGSVSGAGQVYAFVGGLVGRNYGTISNSYATGSARVTNAGTAYAGGLVGLHNGGTISNSYATGTVSSTSNGVNVAGGLAGGSAGNIENTYATGSVSITNSFFYWGSAGGLVGMNDNGTITASFYATTDANNDEVNNGGETTDVFRGNANGAGKTWNQLTQSSTFTGWDIASTGSSNSIWRIYDGYSGPLLRSFLQSVTLTADTSNGDKTYDGTAATGTTTYTHSLGSAFDASQVLGSLSYTSASKNAGTYSSTDDTLIVSGLYSAQQGYDISYADANLVIDKASISAVTGITAGNRTYDGTTDTTLNTGSAGFTGLFGNDELSVASASGAFADKNAGDGKTVNIGNIVLGGADAGNYTLTDNTATTSANIARAALTITADNASKTAGQGIVLSGYTSSGMVAGDNLASVSLNSAGTLASAAAGNYAIVASDAMGAGLSNYDINYVDGALQVIAAATEPSPVSSGQPYIGMLASNGQTVSTEAKQQANEPEALTPDMLVTTPLDEHLNLQIINHGIRLPEGI